ncbi:MAG: hypothetical protein H5T69_20135 [Chloroflexi bacterium]|nr:hypothetical protein [Chloroflexota bacterium]
MTSNEFSIQEPKATEKRVVEAEFKLPSLEELSLPKIDLESVRVVAEDVLLTGIGAAVLLARGVTSALRAANQAGIEAAKNPGPVTGALLSLVRKPGKRPAAEGVRVQVPVLPIDNYDQLSAKEILSRLPELSEEQLRVLREYELANARRTTVLKAIDRQLGVA